jgi:hypothetical protein
VFEDSSNNFQTQGRGYIFDENNYKALLVSGSALFSGVSN